MYFRLYKPGAEGRQVCASISHAGNGLPLSVDNRNQMLSKNNLERYCNPPITNSVKLGGEQISDAIDYAVRLPVPCGRQARVNTGRTMKKDSTMDGPAPPELVNITATIVAAFVSNNSIASTDLPGLIADTHAALSRAAGRAGLPAEREESKPKVAVKKSVMPDFIICLEDGKKFKSLKRHLRTHYNLSPEDYREKWGLPHDYPKVAPNYAQARSNLAKKMGLGTRREK